MPFPKSEMVTATSILFPRKAFWVEGTKLTEMAWAVPCHKAKVIVPAIIVDNFLFIVLIAPF
jgi:hypothetical protein